MSEPDRLAWSRMADGISLRVRLTPRSSADAICGLVETPDGPALQIKVRALPADGAANSAVEKVLAKWLGVSKSSVHVHSGRKSRVKLLHVIGDAATLVQVVDKKMQEIAPGK